MNKTDYQKSATEARKAVLGLIHKAQVSHIASNFSCIDLLTVLFEKADLSRDKILFSKGWVAASAYYFLAQKGILDWEKVKKGYCDGRNKYIGLVEPGTPGIHFAGGSMGYGLPAGVGFALAKKLQHKAPKNSTKGEVEAWLGKTGKVYVLMSDGEMDCGTTWESALIANHHGLDNLVVIVDNNGFQATGRKEDVLTMWPMGISNKWEAFGWHSLVINGHDYEEIRKALFPVGEGHLNENKFFQAQERKPLVIVAHTIKGKGVSFMEKEGLRWHYQNIDDEHYKLALAELIDVS